MPHQFVVCTLLVTLYETQVVPLLGRDQITVSALFYGMILISALSDRLSRLH